MKHRQKCLFSIMLISLMLLSQPAMAGYDWDNQIASDKYGVRAPARLFHGILNVGLGWTQLILEPAKSFGHPEDSLFEGLLNGVSGTLYYTGLGVFEIATFWMPGEEGKKMAIKDCVTLTFQDEHHEMKKEGKEDKASSG